MLTEIRASTILNTLSIPNTIQIQGWKWASGLWSEREELGQSAKASDFYLKCSRCEYQQERLSFWGFRGFPKFLQITTLRVRQRHSLPLLLNLSVLIQAFDAIMSRDNAVGIAPGYGMDDWGVGVRVPVRSTIFSSPCRLDRFWGPPASYPMDAKMSFPGGNTAEAQRWRLISN
jgi:hypothetical protein